MTEFEEMRNDENAKDYKKYIKVIYDKKITRKSSTLGQKVF